MFTMKQNQTRRARRDRLIVPSFFGSGWRIFGLAVSLFLLVSVGAEASASLIEPLGTRLDIISTQDDAVQTVAASFPLKLGTTTYNQLHVSSNGVVSFGHSYSSWSSVNLSRYATGPLIAVQSDDIDPRKGGDIYYYADDEEMRITFQNVRPYSQGTHGTATSENTLQLVITRGSNEIDFSFEIRYVTVNWHRLSTAGWTLGNQLMYGEVPYSGTNGFHRVVEETNVGTPGVYRWDVIDGMVISTPTVGIPTVTDIGANEASAGAEVLYYGGSEVNAQGFVWSTNPYPTLTSNEGSLVVSRDSAYFNGLLSGLTAGRLYYVRAYATNETGTAYGGQHPFWTSRLQQTITFEEGPWQTKQYGDESFEVPVEVSSGLPVNFSSSNSSVAFVAGNRVYIRGVGSTVITAYQHGNSQYEAAVPVERSLTVTKAPLTVTVEEQNKSYDGQPYSGFTVSYSGFVNHEQAWVLSGALVFSGEAVDAVDVGRYAIQADGLQSNYYAITYVDGTLDITPRELTVTGDDQSKVYDGQPFGDFTVRYSGFVDGEDESSLFGELIFADETVGAVNVGTYAIEMGGLDSPNYAISYVGSVLTITPRHLTVISDNQAKAYDGQPFTDFTVSYSGFAEGEDESILTGNVAFSGEAVNAVDVGSYTVQANGLESSNYEITYVDGTLQITPRALVVTAESQSKTYDGQPFTDFTVNYEGFAAGDDASTLQGTLSYSGDAADAVNIGSYTIQVSGLESDNYKLTYLPGTLSILERLLDIRLLDHSKIYGEEDPTLLFEITSDVLDSGDPLTGAPTREIGETVGQYRITQGTLSAGSNYHLEVNEAVFAIVPKELTILGLTIADKVYDGSDIAVVASYGRLEGVREEDDVVLDTSQARVVFTDPNIGLDKTVTVHGLGLSGADAASYTVASPSDLVGTILPPAPAISGGRVQVEVLTAESGSRLQLFNAADRVIAEYQLEDDETQHVFTEVPPGDGYYVVQIVRGAVSGPSNLVDVASLPVLSLLTHVQPDGSGSIQLQPAKELYEDGDIVQVTARPTEGNTFIGWIINDQVATENPLEFAIHQDTVLEANFLPTTAFDVQVSLSRNELRPGDPVTITITLTNTGATDLVDVPVEIVLSPFTFFNSASGHGRYNAASRTVQWTIEDLPAARSFGAVEALSTTSSFTVQATMDQEYQSENGEIHFEVAAGAEGQTGRIVATADATVEITPELFVTLRADKEEAVPGDVIQYTITYANNGDVRIDEAMLTLNLPDHVRVQGSQGMTTRQSKSEFDLNTLQPGERGTLIIPVVVDDPMPFGATPLTAQVEGIAAQLEYPVYSREAITAVVSSYLRVDVEILPREVEVGDTVTVRSTLRNRSEDQSTADIQYTAWIPQGFTYIEGSARLDQDPFPDLDGETTLSWTIGELIPASQRILTYQLRVTPNVHAGINYHAAQIGGITEDGYAMVFGPVRTEIFVQENALTGKGLIVGQVFRDHNRSGMFEDGDEPLAHVRLLMSNGWRVVTDEFGRFHVPGVDPGVYGILVDPRSLPEELQASAGTTHQIRVPRGGMIHLLLPLSEQ